MSNIEKKTPKVSIGMPVYNGEPFIREALDSLLAQTFTDFELIISDNASTDKTKAICQEYEAKDQRIRYVQQSENRGPAENFQFVLNESIGEYFMWAAADDYLDCEQYLSEMISVFLLEPKVDYAFPNISILDVRKNTNEKRMNIMSPFAEAKTQSDFAIASISINSYQIYGLFKKAILIKDFIYLDRCKDLSCYNEGLFVHAISTNRRGVFVPKAIKLYRRHFNNASSTQPAKNLLYSFLRYWIRSFVFFLSNDSLSTLVKCKILFHMSYKNMRYSFYLLLSIFNQAFPSVKHTLIVYKLMK